MLSFFKSLIKTGCCTFFWDVSPPRYVSPCLRSTVKKKSLRFLNNCIVSIHIPHVFDLIHHLLIYLAEFTALHATEGWGDATCWHSKNRSSYWSCMFSATATNTWRCCCPTGLLFTALSQNPQHDGLYSQIYYCFSSILFLLSITAFYWAFCSFNLFIFLCGSFWDIYSILLHWA